MAIFVLAFFQVLSYHASVTVEDLHNIKVINTTLQRPLSKKIGLKYGTLPPSLNNNWMKA